MKQFFAVLLFVCSLNSAFSAQEPKRITRSFSSDNSVIIREVGAVITTKDDNLVVEVILGNNEKESADIVKDDLVLMANGKKLKSMKDLRDQYDNAKIGDEFKLGLKRGENLMISTFVKKSDEELNKAGNGRMMIRMEKKEGEEALPALGLIVGTNKKSVVVNGTLPTVSKNFKSFEPKQGDVIVSINGNAVSNAEEFAEAYTELEEGDKVTIVISRNGKEMKETFSKPKPMGRMIINK